MLDARELVLVLVVDLLCLARAPALFGAFEAFGADDFLVVAAAVAGLRWVEGGAFLVTFLSLETRSIARCIDMLLLALTRFTEPSFDFVGDIIMLS